MELFFFCFSSPQKKNSECKLHAFPYGSFTRCLQCVHSFIWLSVVAKKSWMIHLGRDALQIIWTYQSEQRENEDTWHHWLNESNPFLFSRSSFGTVCEVFHLPCQTSTCPTHSLRGTLLKPTESIWLNIDDFKTPKQMNCNCCLFISTHHLSDFPLFCCFLSWWHPAKEVGAGWHIGFHDRGCWTFEGYLTVKGPLLGYSVGAGLIPAKGV